MGGTHEAKRIELMAIDPVSDAKRRADFWGKWGGLAIIAIAMGIIITFIAHWINL